MTRIEAFKRVLALLIACCLFLPLAQCTHKVAVDGVPGTEVEKADVLIPIENLRVQSWEDAAFFGAFLWPPIFLLLRRRARTPRSLGWLSAGEVLLAGWSLYTASMILVLWGTVRYGGVIFVSSSAAYLLLAAPTVFLCVRPVFRRRSR